MANRDYLKKKKKLLTSVFQNTSRKITEMILKNNIFSSKCFFFFLLKCNFLFKMPANIR